MPRSVPTALAPLAANPLAVQALGPATPVPATPSPTPSLWHLGIEAQELTSRIARLADLLEAEEPEQQQAAIASLEEALLAEEGNREGASRQVV